MAKKEKFMDSITTKTPRGVAIWVHVKEPDTKFEGEPKYKLTLKLAKEGSPNQEAIDKFVSQVDDLIAAALKKAGPKAAAAETPIKDGDEREWKGEGDNPYAGYWLVGMKSKYQPKIVDAKGNAVAADVFPSGGDIVRVGVELVPFSAKAKNIGTGVSLRLLGVQIVEKRARGFDDWSDESDDSETETDTDGGDTDGSAPDL